MLRVWALPYDLFLDEGRGYLEAMGTSRLALLESLAPNDLAAIDSERLGMSSAVYALALDPTLPSDHDDPTAPDRQTSATMAWLGDPSYINPIETIPSIDELRPVRAFLDAFDSSYLDLLVLLDSHWVGHDAGTQKQVNLHGANENGSITGCDLDDVTLSPLPNPVSVWRGFLSRAHRFRRVMHETGMDIDELDECLQKQSLNDAEVVLNGPSLSRLARYIQQKADFPKLEPMEALSWWGDIEARPTKLSFEGTDAQTKVTLYDRLFLDPDIDPDADGDGSRVTDAFRRTTEREFDIEPGRFIGATGDPVAAHIAAAFRISEAELAALIAGIELAPFDTGFPDGPPKLNLRNLSLLHLRVSIARALELQPSELLRLETLLGVALSTSEADAQGVFHNTHAWPELVGHWQRLFERAWSVDELAFVLDDLRADDAAAHRALVTGVHAARVLQETSDGDTQAVHAGLHDELARLLGLDAEPLAILDASVVGGGYIESIITSTTFNDLDPTVLEAWLAISTDHDFLAAVAADGRFAPWVMTLRRMERAAIVIRHAKLDVPTLRWLTGELAPGQSVADEFALVHLADLGPAGTTAFETLRRTIVLAQLGRRLGNDASAWHDLLTQTVGQPPASLVPDDILDQWSATFDWNPESTRVVAGRRGLTWGHVRALDPMAQLLDGLELITHIGKPAAEIEPWLPSGGVDEVTPEQASAIKLAAQAHHGREAWSAIAVPLRDRLRMAQRDALRAYVGQYYDTLGTAGDPAPGNDVPDPDTSRWVTPKSLEAWMLHDNFVEPCRMTSRVREGLTALQALHFQHHALEPERDWERRYRTWEVQRKLAMYPENWLDPAFRDDETEIFAELAETLASGPSDEATIETALARYVDGLDQIARLEICGVVEHVEHAKGITSRRVQHIFGRVRGKAGKLWHRQREFLAGGATRFSAWTRLPFETTSRDLLPVVYADRLFVIWPTFEVKPDAEGQAQLDGASSRTHLRVRLSWAELHRGVWREPRDAKGFLSAFALRHHRSCGALTRAPKHRSEQVAQAIRECIRGDHTAWARAEAVSDIFLESRVDPETHDLQVWVRFLYRHRFYDAGYFGLGACASGLAAHAVHAPSAGTETNPKPGPRAEIVGQRYRGHHRFALAAGDPELLRSAPARAWEAVVSRDEGFVPGTWGVYQDELRSFLATQKPKSGYLGLRGGDSVELEAAVSGQPIAHLAPDLQSQWARRAVLPAKNSLPKAPNIQLIPLQHPFICLLRSQLERHGIEGIYRPPLEGAGTSVRGLVRQTLESSLFTDTMQPGSELFEPGPALHPPDGSSPTDAFEFGYGDAYAQYNWELFYHIPMTIARRLMDDRKFAEARRWLHFILDPRKPSADGDGVDYWQIKPFAGVPDSIESILRELTVGGADSEGYLAGVAHLADNPFEPFGVARLRPSCFMRATVMLYLDNLIAWGDELFRAGSIESVAEATQLYVMAQNLLGARPERLPAQSVAGQSWSDLLEGRDLGPIGDVGNAMVEIENLVTHGRSVQRSDEIGERGPLYGKAIADDPQAAPALQLMEPGATSPRTLAVGGPLARASVEDGAAYVLKAPRRSTEFHTVANDVGDGQTLYFCVPPNERLLAYWDRVDDRLYKVRYCLDLEGRPRTIRLFEPPIDPGALIAALAEGSSLSAALDQLNAPPPTHRFAVHLAQAQAYTDVVIRLGRNLEAAFSSADGESFAQLEADHRRNLLAEEQRVLQAQLDAAQASVAATDAARDVVDDRIAHFQGLVDTGISDRETQQAERTKEAAVMGLIASQIAAAGGFLALIPTFEWGGKGAGTPVAVAHSGGFSVAGLLNAIASSTRGVSRYLGALAQRSAVSASHARRAEEWSHQLEVAQAERSRLDREFTAAKARVDISGRELERHAIDTQHADAIIEFLAEKYSRPEFHRWLASEVKKLYYRCFNLALQAAKRARASLARELAIAPDSIRLDGWRGQNEGLRVGEKLRADLRAMSHAYHTGHGRELEITKQFSLARDNPAALLELQNTGRCDFDVTELHYDLDHPGHVLRRIQSVGVTVSSIRGAHTDLPAELTLVRSEVRDYDGSAWALRPDTTGDVARIATSGAPNDVGLFSESTSDGRYLPFEHRGAISSWRLRLPECQRGFDYASIGDVVLTLRYTARDGGALRRSQAVTALDAAPLVGSVGGEAAPSWLADGLQMWRGYSARSDFSSAWTAWKLAGTGALTVTASLRNLGLEEADPNSVRVFCAAVFRSGLGPGSSVSLTVDGNAITLATPVASGPADPIPELLVGPSDWASAAPVPLDTGGTAPEWSFQFSPANLVADLEDLLIYVSYTPRGAR